MVEMAQLLNKSFPTYKISENVLPLCSVKIISILNPKLKLLLPFWGHDWKYKNEKSK